MANRMIRPSSSGWQFRFSLRTAIAILTVISIVLAGTVWYDQHRWRSDIASLGSTSTPSGSRHDLRAVWVGNKAAGLRLTVAVAVLEPTGSGFKGSISAGRSLNAPTGSGLDLCASHGLYLDGRKIDTSGTMKVFAFVNVVAAKGEDRPGLIPIKLSKSDLDGLALENIKQPAELASSPIWQKKVVPQIDAIYAKEVMPWIENWQRHSLISAGVAPESSAD